MKTKILFLIHDLGGGGAEKVLVNLVNHMDYKKYDISVLALFGGGVNEKYISDKVHYECIWKKAFPKNSYFLKKLPSTFLYKLCIHENYDIEIAFLEDICAKIISGSTSEKAKKICWIHTDLHDKRTASRGFKNFTESVLAFGKYKRIACVSESVKEDFITLYPKLRDVQVLYNTLDTQTILKMKDEELSDIQFNKEVFNLISVGKITKKKGIDRLARITKRLLDNNIPIHMYILGEGKDKEEIVKYLKNERILYSWTFLGYQSNPYKYVANCDLLVCASLAEGFSTAATEALIVGTPVCTVDVSGMKEMLGYNNEWGIVTENNESALFEGVRVLLKKPELLNYYKRRATERGKYFRIEQTVAEVERFLEDSLSD